MGDHVADRLRAADDLFDKYLLPKVALTIILAASLVGTAVSLSLSSGWSWSLGLAKWVFFVSLAVLTGGLCWKHAFVRPGDVTGDAAAYSARTFARFDRIALGATILLFATTPFVVRAYPPLAVGHNSLFYTGGLLLAFAFLAGWMAIRDRPAADIHRSHLGIITLAVGVLATLAVTVLEVRAGGEYGAIPMVVRGVHLLAFSVWLGGAVWNIFAAVPSGQAEPTLAVIEAAGEQLERFRGAVRVIIPTIVLTGVVQAVLEFGHSLAPYTTSLIGVAIVAKLGLIGVLFAIFLTCPMWRACSPIDGVCDLTDLDDPGSEAVDASGGVIDD